MNQPQPSTRISFQENPYTYEERRASLSEPLIPAICHAPVSEPQNESTCNIYHYLLHDLNRNRNPSKIKIKHL